MKAEFVSAGKSALESAGGTKRGRRDVHFCIEREIFWFKSERLFAVLTGFCLRIHFSDYTMHRESLV